MEFLELFKGYFFEVFLFLVDLVSLFLYHKFFGQTSKASFIAKLEKKVARDYERLKADESVLEEYKKGDSE